MKETKMDKKEILRNRYLNLIPNQPNKPIIIGISWRSENEKYGIQVFSEITTALLEKPFAIVISTPPDLHMKFAKIAIENKIPFFTYLSA